MNRNGFSLVELLIVLAVLSLLLAIALPVLRQTRSQGQELVCAAHLRQISISATAYAQEKKTFPPGFCGLLGYGGTPPSGVHGDSSFDWQGWWWFDFLADWLGTDSSAKGPLWCPSRKLARGADTDHVLCGNYGVNTSICLIASQASQTEFVGIPLRATQIKNPASSVLATDSGYALISWKSFSPDTLRHPFESTSRQNTYYLPGAAVNLARAVHPDHLRDATEGRHTGNKVNAGYADGHVEYERPKALSPEFDENGNPRNYSAWSASKYR